jgi:hypothetical protein
LNSDTHAVLTWQENYWDMSCTAMSNRFKFSRIASSNRFIPSHMRYSSDPPLTAVLPPRAQPWIGPSLWGEPRELTNSSNSSARSSLRKCMHAKNTKDASGRPPRAGPLDSVGSQSQTTTVRNVQSILHTHSPPWSPPRNFSFSFCRLHSFLSINCRRV